MILRIGICIFACCFFYPKNVHSFYDFYGDVPLQFEATFRGDVVISSTLLNYTNTDITFSFDYAIQTRSQYTEKYNIVTDWFFSPIKNSNMPRIFSTIWNRALEQNRKNLLYSVVTEEDRFLVFDKRGNQSPLTYVFEIFFPLINDMRTKRQSSYQIELLSIDELPENYFLNIHGWNFNYPDIVSTEPSLITWLPTQTFMSNFYNEYAQSLQTKQNDLFWVQEITLDKLTVFRQRKNRMQLVGMYIIDLKEKQIKNISLIGTIKATMPYGEDNFLIPVDIELNGTWDIKAIDPNSIIDSVVEQAEEADLKEGMTNNENVYLMEY